MLQNKYWIHFLIYNYSYKVNPFKTLRRHNLSRLELIQSSTVLLKLSPTRSEIWSWLDIYTQIKVTKCLKNFYMSMILYATMNATESAYVNFSKNIKAARRLGFTVA